MVPEYPPASVFNPRGGTVGRRPSEIDELFQLLAHRYRRYLLGFLRDEDDAVTVRTCAEQVAARASCATGETDSPDACQRITTALHHTHLPKLAEAGLVEYDRQRRRVGPGSEMTRCEQLLDMASQFEGDVP